MMGTSLPDLALVPLTDHLRPLSTGNVKRDILVFIVLLLINSYSSIWPHELVDSTWPIANLEEKTKGIIVGAAWR